jgi:hypothetical protein
MSLRKITKNRGSFPSDDALLNLFYLLRECLRVFLTFRFKDKEVYFMGEIFSGRAYCWHTGDRVIRSFPNLQRDWKTGKTIYVPFPNLRVYLLRGRGRWG